MAHRLDDLDKGLARSISRHGKLRRAGMMLAAARHAASTRGAEVAGDPWDCLEEYVNDLAKCENQYSQAVGDADDAFVACLRSKEDVVVCFDQYDLALDNAILALDGCQARIAAKWIDCFGRT